MKTGDYLRWTGDDESGELVYTGTITRMSKGKVSFMSSIGRITVPDDDGVFKILKKTERVQQETPMPSPVDTIPVKTSQTMPKGKLGLIIALLKKTPPSSRKDAIEKIVAAGISSPAGASTHYNNAKRWLT